MTAVSARERPARWKLSRYTHIIPTSKGGVVYNGRTGAVAEFEPKPFRALNDLVAALPEGRDARLNALQRQLLRHCKTGGFVVPAGEDEVATLEAEYHARRRDSQFLITILPTFACNLDCAYCFVGKKKGFMDETTQNRVVEFARNHVARKHPPNMWVDWFGGEPLLAPAIIERLSNAFIEICDAAGIPYWAHVITNGTRLDESVVEMLLGVHVDRLQITLDGPPSIHDLRRPYKAGQGSSFARIMEAIPRVIGRFLIRLRINVDKQNLPGVWPLLDLFEQRGWIGPDTNFFPYLARISAFTDACSGVSSHVTTLDEFWDVQFEWMERLRSRGVDLPAHGLYQFPEPKIYNCGAVGSNGFVFTPEGEVHKCGLEVDDSRRAIGRLGESFEHSRFADYSPFRHPVCRECEFLPTCLGGCPRDRIDNRTLEVKNNCDYHKRFEQQILLFHLGHRAATAMPPPSIAQARAVGLFPILA